MLDASVTLSAAHCILHCLLMPAFITQQQQQLAGLARQPYDSHPALYIIEYILTCTPGQSADLWQHLASAGFDADKATLYLLEGFIGMPGTD